LEVHVDGGKSHIASFFRALAAAPCSIRSLTLWTGLLCPDVDNGVS
jgi:hypothetical protein